MHSNYFRRIRNRIITINFFQQRVKEEKEAKKAQLNFRHEFIIEKVSYVTELETSEIIDLLCEGSQVIYIIYIKYPSTAIVFL